MLVDLGMDVPGQVVMLIFQTEPNRKSPLYKPGKAMPRPESWAIRLAWGRRINYAASVGWPLLNRQT